MHVLNHPHCIDHADLQKAVIVAVQPNPQHYVDNPDEIEEDFWLAKIVSHKTRHSNWTFKVCWFENQTLGEPNKPSYYILDESTTAEIPYGAILYHRGKI